MNSNPIMSMGPEWVKYFPKQQNLDPDGLQISRISKYMITRPTEAEEMSNHILRFCKLLGMSETKSLRVTDATAGCGGNTLNLLKHFNHVTAVERDPVHFQCLQNNLGVYGVSDKATTTSQATAKLIQADYTHVYNVLQQDIILIDCPWSDDTWYSRKKDLQLYLSDIPLYNLVRDIFAQSATRVVAIKAPGNFGFSLFFRKLSGNLLVKVCHVYTYYLILIALDG